MRALATSLVSALVAALLMAAGGAFLRHELSSRLDRDAARLAEDGATWTRAAYVHQEELEAILLGATCARDVAIERLGLELDAGALAAGSVDRAAEALARTLARPIALSELREGRVTTLGRSTRAPRLDLALEALRVSLNEATLVRGADGARWLARSCVRALRGRELVVTSLRSLDAAWLGALGAPPGTWKLRFGDHASDADAAHTAHATALTLQAVDGDGARVLVEVPKEADERFDLALALSVLMAFLLAGAAGYWVGHRREVHERALEELERAAERVAQGDLSSTINLALGDRADQTFQTFDRMTKELRDMRARLAEAEREAAFRDVARRIAHEIKNPLVPIQMAMETLRKARAKQRGDFDEIFEESTRAILDEVKRLDRIVREFGEFARLPKSQPSELDLGALVRDTLPLYVPEGVALEVMIAPELPRVRADREQLTQVLVNLVKNALDAARTSATPRLRVCVEATEAGIRLRVDDDGPGIALGDRERVFEPYYTTKDEGTGLGLAIVKRIITDHGGTIGIEASEWRGASVQVTLPITPGPSRTP